MKKNTFFILLLCLVTFACSKKPKSKLLFSSKMNSIENVITKSLVTIDLHNSKDGNGSLKFVVDKPITIKLFEIPVTNIHNAKLIYRAYLKCKNLKGKAYLEMWCHFKNLGEYFSRGIYHSISGDMDWNLNEIYFFLKKEQYPDLIKLNIVVDGTGIIWVDKVQLLAFIY